jgi:dipeptidyl-peptidase-4
VLGPEASAITFARIAKFPEPGWNVPRAIRHSPDGKLVTYLQSEDMSDKMSLMAFDKATHQTSVLVRAADLLAMEPPRSAEEELRRERQRKRVEGVTSYRWAKHAPMMVIPHGDDIFVRDAAGKLSRLTATPDPEIDPVPCEHGERIAFVRKGELFAIDVATKKETQLTTGSTEGVTHGLTDFLGQEEFDEEHGFEWSPKCDRLLYLEVDERKVEKIPVMGWRKGTPSLSEQRYPEVGKTNPSVKLGIVDLATKQTTWVKFPTTAERYVTRITWSDDGRSIYAQVFNREQTKRTLVRIGPTTGAVTELYSEESKAWIEPSPMRVLGKRGEIVMTSDATGHRHLETRRADDGRFIRKLTDGDWDVGDVLAVDEEKGNVLVSGTRDGVLERHAYRVPLDGGAIERVTQQHGVHGFRPDELGRSWVDVNSAHDRIARAEVWDGGKHVGDLPIPIDADLDKLGVRPLEYVKVRGAAGDVLEAAMLRPRRHAAGEKHPAIVFVYGGPSAQTVFDLWSANLYWQHLADRGFFVIQIDGRGSGGRGPAWDHKMHLRFGGAELEDQVAGAKWLATLPEVDPTRIGIYGHSYGGFVAAAAMLKTPGAFAAAVAGSPVTDWRLYDSAYTERYMGTPSSNPDGYAASELPRFASQLQGPLFIMHGAMDENVHYTNTARLIDALVAADKKFDLLVLPGERHGTRDAATRAYVYERVAAWFAEHL